MTTCRQSTGPAGSAVLVEQLTAADLMSTDVLVVGEDESVVMASYLMQQAAVRHLPVVTDGRVVGVLDDLRLAGCLTHLGWDDLRHPVRAVMHRDVVRVRPRTGLRDVAEHLGFSRSGMVVVTDDGELLGVITRSDVIAAVARHVPRLPSP